jgi:cytochrome c biogenesis protein CcdA
MNKINWQLIIIHLIATFFVTTSSIQFGTLNDVGILELIDQNGVKHLLQPLSKDDKFASRLANFSLWSNLSTYFGLLLAVIISIILTLKRNQYWLNALIVFAIALLLNGLGFFENKLVDTLFLAPGNLTEHWGPQYKFITNGILLAVAGFFTFFNRGIDKITFNYQASERESSVK